MKERISEILKQSENGIYYGSYKESEYNLAYYTSVLRENLINWITIDDEARILYIAIDYGVFVHYLCQQAKQVDILVENPNQIEAVTHRCQYYENCSIIDTDLFTYETLYRYDYIIAIDYIHNLSEKGILLSVFFEKLYSFLSPTGKILVGIDNALGLRYFNGFFDESGILYHTFSDSFSPVSYTKYDIEKALEVAHIYHYKFYYPFPEYAFPRTVFTDEILKYTIFGHHYNTVGFDRFKLFDEFDVFVCMQNNGIADRFSNSFLIEINKNGKFDNCIYAKNQYYIGKEHKILTRILNKNGKLWCEKVPLTPEAKDYLKKLYEDSKGMADSCHFKYINYLLTGSGSLVMDFIVSKSLSTILCEILHNYLNNVSINQEEMYTRIIKILEELYDALQADAVLKESEEIYTDSFKQRFGDCVLKGPLYCIYPCTLDLHCDHIYPIDKKYYIIDTDPIVFFPIPIKYLMWSIIESWIYGYVKNNIAAEKVLSTSTICERLNILPKETAVFERWKKNQYSDADAMSAISKLYGRVYKANFLNYSDIEKNGYLINSNDRRTEIQKEEKGNFILNRQVPIIVYGAAAIGYALKVILDYFGFNLIGYIDKRYEEISEAHGLPVWSIKDAPHTKDTVIIVGTKNVFEHEGIAKELVNNGFFNLLYKSTSMLDGTETQTDFINMEQTYDYLLGLKGKDLSKCTIFTEKYLPQTTFFKKEVLTDRSFISEDSNYILANMPITNIFTAQRILNPSYIWAEQSILSLLPHTKLYKYLWEGGEDKTEWYIDFCAYGARNNGVKMTDGWKQNLISNRLTVLAAMKKALESEKDFFYRNAPEAIYNFEYNYFNLNGGRHRATLFVYDNNYLMPIKVIKSEYEYFINRPVIEKVNNYIDSHPDFKFNNSIAHPYLHYLAVKRPQYYQLVLKNLIEILAQKDLEKYNKICFQNYSVGIYADDHGELKRLMSHAHFKVYNLKVCTEVDLLLDELFRYEEEKCINEFYDICFYDLTEQNKDNWATTIDKTAKDMFFLIKDGQEEIIKLRNLFSDYIWKNIGTSYWDNEKICFVNLEKSVG